MNLCNFLQEEWSMLVLDTFLAIHQLLRWVEQVFTHQNLEWSLCRMRELLYYCHNDTIIVRVIFIYILERTTPLTFIYFILIALKSLFLEFILNSRVQFYDYKTWIWDLPLMETNIRYLYINIHYLILWWVVVKIQHLSEYPKIFYQYKDYANKYIEKEMGKLL